MKASQETIKKILNSLKNVKKTGKDQYTSQCPAHEDNNNSLSLQVIDGGFLFHCFAGCLYSDIIRFLPTEVRHTKHDDTDNDFYLKNIYEKSKKEIQYVPKQELGNEIIQDLIPKKKLGNEIKNGENNFLILFLKNKFGDNFIGEVTYPVKDNKTAFWYKDKNNTFLNAKCIEYKDDLHRNKDIPPFFLLRETGKCWFNENKIATNENIIIVESEKTAVILENILPKTTIIATGGATIVNNLNYKLLMNKKVLLIADFDTAGEKWEKNIESILIKNKISYSIYNPESYDNTDYSDIADILLDNLYNDEILCNIMNKIKNLFETIEPPEDTEENTFISWKDMKNFKRKEIDFLLTGIIPRTGLIGLVGPPDTGKSQFCRQLCISICLRYKKFLDFDLTQINNRIIFISTEDSPEMFRMAMQKQLDGMESNEEPDNFNFFSFSSTDTNLIEIIKNFMNENKVDLIVIDSLGDVYEGSDMSNNTEMRKYLK
ncbi:MAG: DUF6371 domain-containing protein, partial [FCB group bacterium]